MYTVNDLYDLNHSIAGSYLAGFSYPWEALDGIKELILRLGSTLGDDYAQPAPRFGSIKPP